MKSLFKLLLLIIAPILATSITACNSKDNPIAGEWNGILTIQGKKLRILFDIELIDSKLNAKMYSLDQSEQPIKASSVELVNNMLRIIISSIGVDFQGKLAEDKGTITGNFSQNGMNFELTLKKAKENELYKSPISKIEDEEISDLYNSIDVNFENKVVGISLSGTLTIPKSGGNFPAVVLVSGSGPQNRNEELMGHKPFKRIANYLSSNGFVVLRYDDRGFGESGGEFATSTTQDFLSDAMAAVNYLKTYQGVDSSRIGIIGHSEGGQIAVMAAAQYSNVKFIISLAGPMMVGEELILLQADRIAQASGSDDATIKNNRTLNSAIYAILRKKLDDTQTKLDIMATIKHYATNDQMKKDSYAEMMAKTVLTPWFRQFLENNAADYILNVKCPTLLMFGEKDLQVPAIENEAAYYKALDNKTKSNVTLITIKDVNHLFQNAITGAPSEYSDLTKPSMSDETLDTFYKWMKNNIM